MRLLASLLSLSASIPLSACWGTLGHRTVAYVAQKSLSQAGASYVSQLLQDEDISEAALWADHIKRKQPKTAPWHYIDAEDDPPNSCNVNYKRDCVSGTGCIISAIVDMTSRVNDASLSFDDHQEALKFLLHFLGDVHQPLHTEAEERGGNGIKVLFGRRHTDLHAIWDTDMPVKHEGGRSKDEPSQASDWADRLVQGGAGDGWLSCTDTSQAERCSLEWAGEANKYVCSYVLKDGVDGVTGRDLSTGYFEGAVPILDEMIAKAGFRLAAWVDALAGQRVKMMESGVVFQGPEGKEGQQVLGGEEL